VNSVWRSRTSFMRGGKDVKQAEPVWQDTTF
jgi:hypothetical protein